MRSWGVIVLLALIMAAAVSCNVSIWNECRADHSFSYCMRLISK